MLGVLVEFQYTNGFDHDRIVEIARRARTSFEGMPGLRQKTFTVDEQNHRAVNFYVWESDEAAHGFFGAEIVERVTGLYGVRPRITFVEIAELVDNV